MGNNTMVHLPVCSAPEARTTVTYSGGSMEFETFRFDMVWRFDIFDIDISI